MRNLSAYLILFMMITNVAASTWKQWQAWECYEWTETYDQERKIEETKSEDEAEKELFLLRKFDHLPSTPLAWSQRKNGQILPLNLVRLRTQCHGALPDMPPEA